MSAADHLVLRTVYIDPDVEERLSVEARALKASKAALLRRYLTAGRRRAKSQPELFRNACSVDQAAPLVLKHVHLDAKLDHHLVVEAFDSRTSKNDLLRRYLRFGLETAAA